MSMMRSRRGYNREACKCKKCGKRIKFVQTVNGKSMPCDPVLIPYRADGGKDRIVTHTGKVISGTFEHGDGEFDGYGYISHFATCEHVQTFRRK